MTWLLPSLCTFNEASLAWGFSFEKWHIGLKYLGSPLPVETPVGIGDLRHLYHCSRNGSQYASNGLLDLSTSIIAWMDSRALHQASATWLNSSSHRLLFLLYYPCSRLSRSGSHSFVSPYAFLLLDSSRPRPSAASYCLSSASAQYRNYSESHLSPVQSGVIGDVGPAHSACLWLEYYLNLVDCWFWMGCLLLASSKQIWLRALSFVGATSWLPLVSLGPGCHWPCPDSLTFW